MLLDQKHPIMYPPFYSRCFYNVSPVFSSVLWHCHGCIKRRMLYDLYNLYLLLHFTHCHQYQTFRLSLGITKVIRTPLGTMKVCSYFWSNPRCRHLDVYCEKWKLGPNGGSTGKVKGSPKSLGFILWEPPMALSNFMAIHCWDISVWTKVVDQ